MAKLKMTGFARLVIAMIVIVPLAYLGATFINGGDSSLNDLKELLGIETSATPTVDETETVIPAEHTTEPSVVAPPPMGKAGQDEEVMNELRDKLNEMYDENSALKEEVLRLRKELEASTRVQ